MYRALFVPLLSAAVFSLFVNASCHKTGIPSVQDGNWVQAAAIPNYPRSGAATFTIGDKAFVGLGLNETVGGNGRLNDFWSFSLDSGWTQIATFPGTARSNAASFTIDNYGYVGTGTDGLANFSDFYRYDPAGDAWEPRKPYMGGTRCDAVGFAVQGKGYIGTGYDKFWLNDFYQYDPDKDSWERTPGTAGNFSKRRGAVAFVHNDKAYVVTGSYNNSMVKDFWSFDPSQSKPWTQLGDIVNSDVSTADDQYTDIVREYATVFVNNNKAYLTLGRNVGLVSSTWMYDFDQQVWSRRTPFPSNRAGRFMSVGFTVGGQSFVGTGDSGNKTTFDDFNMFVPDQLFNPND